jgi:hypothetical protein
MVKPTVGQLAENVVRAARRVLDQLHATTHANTRPADTVATRCNHVEP